MTPEEFITQQIPIWENELYVTDSRIQHLDSVIHKVEFQLLSIIPEKTRETMLETIRQASGLYDLRIKKSNLSDLLGYKATTE